MGNIALIPARGGSKRIPKKNIRLFLGKPIIAYSIEAAQKSNCFEKIIVSTDCPEIKKIALEYGAEVPFVRPKEISDDLSTTIDVIKHCIEWLNGKDTPPSLICCIYATAPFIKPSDIIKGCENLNSDEHASYSFTVTSFPFPIQRALKIKNGKLKMFQPEHLLTRSQDLEEAYHDAGQFYWGKPKSFLENTPIFSKKSIPIKLPRYLVQDIDTEEDWLRAELLYKASKLTKESSKE